MAKRRIEVDIVANDQASSIFTKVKNNASGMASHLTTVLDSSVKFERSLRSYNSAMHGFNRVAGDVMRAAGRSIYNFTKDAINNFSELERQHAKTMGAMATDYAKTAEAQAKFLADSEKLKQQAIQIGSYGVNGKGALNTITDVSYAQTALIKSGLSANDILNTDVVESILKFAGGNDLDVDTATTFAVNLGTVFDKPIEEWGKMLDMITKAADISVIDVEDIMQSLTYTGGIASGLGRDLEEVLGVIAVMGQAGLRGRVAGTGLQAFFTRILSAGELSDTAAGNAPTDYVAQMYNAFTAEAINADGSFKDMDEVAALLDTAMDSLTDQEQAWFAKKLFGLYQMKAAYALTGAVDGDTNLITDFINQITNQSAGANDVKYELMQGSQYGKIASLRNAWEGIKTDFGDKLSPVISATADELLTFLSNNGNYEIDWTKLRDAFDESGDLISAKYGEEIGQAVANIGNLGIDAGIIADAMLPYAGGLINGIALLMQGDIAGALEEFSSGLDETNENIDDLPEELQGSATAARNVIAAFTALAGVNLATQIVQIISTAFNTFLAKPIKWALSKVNSTKTDVDSATSTIQVGTATTINIAQASLMNVTAAVVNVYGGSGRNPTSPTNPTTPLLPGGTPIPLLPNAPTTPLLPGGNSGNSGLLEKGYRIGGEVLTRSAIREIVGRRAGIVSLVLKAAPYLASPGLFDSYEERVNNANNWMDRHALEGANAEDVYSEASTREWYMGKYGKDAYYDDSKDTILKNIQAEIDGRRAARDEMMSYYKTGAGAEIIDELIKAQMEENGKITEEFLVNILSWTKDGYTYAGSQADMEELFGHIYKDFGDKYSKSWIWDGRFDEKGIDKVFNGWDNPFYKSGDTPGLRDDFDYELIDAVISSSSDVINGVGSMIDRIQSPNITVNVTTNVDKNGDATSKVDIGGLSRDISRRASQYGQQAMLN